MYFCAYSEFAKDVSKKLSQFVDENEFLFNFNFRFRFFSYFYVILLYLDLNITIFRIKNKECQRRD